MRRKLKKIICVILAFLFLGIGAIGAVLPVLPTTPFLLAAAFFSPRAPRVLMIGFYLLDFIKIT